MLVGIDSIVDIEELHVVPSQEHPGYMVLKYQYKTTKYGDNDQKFNTDLCAAITNRLQELLQEGVESED